jgi:ribose 5-phosphate isomerase B
MCSAHQGMENDEMNVLVMASRIVGTALAREITRYYIGATFNASEERFLRRLNKVKSIERCYLRNDHDVL